MTRLGWGAKQLIDKAVTPVSRSVFKAVVESTTLEYPRYGSWRMQLEWRAKSRWLNGGRMRVPGLSIGLLHAYISHLRHGVEG
jgi:hypothetical protein